MFLLINSFLGHFYVSGSFLFLSSYYQRVVSPLMNVVLLDFFSENIIWLYLFNDMLNTEIIRLVITNFERRVFTIDLRGW